MDIAFREIIPGFHVFDCSPLSASLSKAACADNFLKRRCLACLDCEIGRYHAGGSAARQPRRLSRPSCSVSADEFGPVGDLIAARCLRCGSGAHRLLAQSVCVSCYNRQRECLLGKNAKGTFPARSAARLRWVTAIVTTDGDLDAAFYPVISHSCRKGSGGLPAVELIDSGHAMVRAIATGADELAAMLARVDTSAEIVEIDVGKTFLEMRMTIG